MRFLPSLPILRMPAMAATGLLALSCAAVAQPEHSAHSQSRSSTPATAARASAGATEADATASAEVSEDATNTMCPVMTSNPINPDLHVDYQGKRVYFCCDGCPSQFEANPERYLDRLPQFGGTEPNATEQSGSTHSETEGHNHTSASSHSGTSSDDHSHQH